MEAAIDRKQTAFRLSTDLLDRLRLAAKKQNRSLNNFVESILMDVVYNERKRRQASLLVQLIWRTSIHL